MMTGKERPLSTVVFSVPPGGIFLFYIYIPLFSLGRLPKWLASDNQKVQPLWEVSCESNWSWGLVDAKSVP